jgi:hypothetical protein
MIFFDPFRSKNYRCFNPPPRLKTIVKKHKNIENPMANTHNININTKKSAFKFDILSIRFKYFMHITIIVGANIKPLIIIFVKKIESKGILIILK